MRTVMRRLPVIIAIAAALLGAALLMRPFLHGLWFVIRAGEIGGAMGRLADMDARTVSEQQVDIASQARPSVIGRMYRPSGRAARMVLLVPGLHPAGINDHRLVELARHLAQSGLAVLTPEITELAQFEITPEVTDEIEASARWLSDYASASGGLTRDARIGLLGISFSGGLSVVAAGRPALRTKVAYVFSLGGHDDLPRVLRYLCTGIEPPPPSLLRLSGTGDEAPGVAPPRPHDYGVAIMLLRAAERLVPPRQVAPLRDGVRRFLVASSLDSRDREKASREFESVRALAKTLPEPSRTLLRHVSERDVIHLGARLLPFVELYGGPAGLSPSRSPKPSAPVFLLHGRDDNVIPAMESEYLAAEIDGHVRPRLLLTNLISHADLERRPRAAEVAELASFWADLLAR